MIVRPSVVLPQPDSPTTPRVSPRMIERSTPSTACTWPTVLFRRPALIGNYLTSPSTRSSTSASARRTPVRVRRRLAHDGRSEVAGTSAARSSSSAKWQARYALGMPNGRSGGTSVRQRVRPCEWTQRGWKAQPGGGAIGSAAGPESDGAIPARPRGGRALFRSPRCTDARGSLKIVKTSPSSTTAARVHHHDAVRELRDHAEVVRDQDRRSVRLSLSAPSTSMICAWIVTSSAVVGSSAIRTSGRWRSPSRSSPRCRMPPENSCGYWSYASPRDRDADERQELDGRARALSSPPRRCAPGSPPRSGNRRQNTGFSDVIGSWKIIAISPPRSFWSSSFGHA